MACPAPVDITPNHGIAGKATRKVACQARLNCPVLRRYFSARKQMVSATGATPNPYRWRTHSQL